MASNSTEEAAIGEVVRAWAAAVRRKDMAGILANHADDILMFDLPPPLLCRGIDAYRRTWSLFYSTSPDPVVFDLIEMNVTAGMGVSFVTALMHCKVIEHGTPPADLDFRVTIGLEKLAGRWTITHEHHSIPAVD
jgi:ketosteroid isomerase-like protein